MKRLGRIVVTAALATAGVAVAASPAAADVNLGTAGGLTYIQGSANTAAPPATLFATATCPAATHVVGGGVTPSGGGQLPEFWVNRSRPFDGPDADANPDDGWVGRGFNRFGTSKGFSTYAICFGGTVRYRTAQDSAAVGSGMSASASCPTGTHVSGGGANLTGTADTGYLSNTYPFDSGDPGSMVDDGWRARAFNRSGSRKTLTVYAACTSFTPQYSATSQTAGDSLFFNACPTGAHAMEGGISTSGPPSQAFVNTDYPYAGTTNPPDTGFVEAIRVIGSPTPMVFHAICKS